MLIDHFRMLLRYESWAGREVVTALRETERLLGDAVGPGGGATMATANAFRRACGIFGHIQMARHEWLSRLGGVERRAWVMFPDWIVDEGEADATRLDGLWASYLDRPEAARMDEVVVYHSTEGKAYRGVRGEMLTHVFHHAHYHRGQIAMLIRQAGGTPRPTDVIFFTRS